MQILINLKIDPKMKSALQKLAEKKFTSMSAEIKQAIEKHLLENDIDWRNENEKK